MSEGESSIHRSWATISTGATTIFKFFSRQNHNSGLRKCTKTDYIRVEFLEQVVQYEVNRLACFVNEYEDNFIKAMMGQSAKVTENDRVRKQRELDVLFEKLYEDVCCKG